MLVHYVFCLFSSLILCFLEKMNLSLDVVHFGRQVLFWQLLVFSGQRIKLSTVNMRWCHWQFVVQSSRDCPFMFVDVVFSMTVLCFADVSWLCVQSCDASWLNIRSMAADSHLVTWSTRHSWFSVTSWRCGRTRCVTRWLLN